MAYKPVACKGSIESISDAVSAIEDLASEMRETYDNMEGANMGHMDKCVMAGEAADTLENVSEPDVPECINNLPIEYTEMRNKRKNAPCSRAVRLENALAVFRAAADAASAFAEQSEEACDDQDAKDAASEFADSCNQIADECDGVEFPGMFG